MFCAEDKFLVFRIMKYLRDHPPSHYLFKVEPFSLLVKSQKEKHESGVFEAGGYKWCFRCLLPSILVKSYYKHHTQTQTEISKLIYWTFFIMGMIRSVWIYAHSVGCVIVARKLILYPKGKEKADGKDHISLYLAIADPSSFSDDWEVNVDFKLFVFNQLENKHLTVQDANEPIKKFHEKKTEWGFEKLLPLETFNEANKGYLVDDCCVFGAEVFVIQPTGRKECLSIMEEPDKGSFSSKLEDYSKLQEDCHDSNIVSVGQRKGKMSVQPKLCDKEQGSSLSVLQRLKGNLFSVFQWPFGNKGVPEEEEEHGECELPALDEFPGVSRTIRELPPAHHLLKIKSFSLLSKQELEKHESDSFEVGGFKWRLSLYPNGCKKRNGNGHISLYLRILETETLPPSWEVNVNFKLFVFDQIRDKYLTIQDADGTVRRFHEAKTEWGFDRLLSLDNFSDASNGFLVKDCCIFGAEIFVIRHNCRKDFPPLVKDNTNDNTFTWKIDKFSTLSKEFYESEEFSMGGRKWLLGLYPKGYGTAKDKWISLYLYLSENSTNLPLTQEWNTNFKLRIRDQANGNHFERTSKQHCYKYPFREGRGFGDFISLTELRDASKGYIKNDTIIIQVIFTYMASRDILLEI